MPDLTEQWKYWAEAAKVPPGALRRWAAQPNPQYHCVFCGRHGPIGAFQVNGITACPACHEYKGIEPCVSSYCEWGEGEE